MRDVLLCIVAILALFVSHIFFPEIAHTAIITVDNLDGAGEGFNDPSAPDSASAAGGNSGVTLGAQRLIAFQRAADIWAHLLSSPVEIRVDANLDPLTCTATSATLGSAGTKTVHGNFAGAPLANTWYPQALANSIAGTDLVASSDIAARFNSAIGTTCPFPLVWYYGLDGNPPGGTLDFVNVVLHELGHGLGFQSFVDLASGTKLMGFNDVFSLNLENHSTGKLYSQMTDAERVSASQNSGNLHWVGPNVVAASGTLTAGVHATGHVQMFAPSPQQVSSSVSHFDTAVTPNELMEPFYTDAMHDVGLTLEVFADLGWAITLSGPTDTDFDGDGKTDVGIYRNGVWYVLRSTDGVLTTVGLGAASGDIPVQSDYDGDGKADHAIFRNGIWYYFQSSNDALVQVGFGTTGDIPVPADYDGDGKADQAIVRNGTWYIRQSSNGAIVQAGLGMAGDIVVPADYDGDGKTDRAIFRNGIWYYFQSSNGALVQVGLGTTGDIPVSADYDGDGKADPAIFRSGIWYIRQSSNGALVLVGLGTAGDITVPADYDGDGKSDPAIFRNGIWYIRQSSNGVLVQVGLGTTGDVPVN